MTALLVILILVLVGPALMRGAGEILTTQTSRSEYGLSGYIGRFLLWITFMGRFTLDKPYTCPGCYKLSYRRRSLTAPCSRCGRVRRPPPVWLKP